MSIVQQTQGRQDFITTKETFTYSGNSVVAILSSGIIRHISQVSSLNVSITLVLHCSWVRNTYNVANRLDVRHIGLANGMILSCPAMLTCRSVISTNSKKTAVGVWQLCSKHEKAYGITGATAAI